MRFRAIAFDCYGTLIDWDTGIGRRLETWAASGGGAPSVDDLLGAFAEAQRAEQAKTPFRPYRSVLANAFEAVGAGAGAAVGDGEADAFAASVGAWPPFADTVAALEALKRQGRTLCAISNVDDDLFEGTRALLGDPFDIVVTAEDVRSYKPAPAHFHALRDRLAERGVDESAILHVARSRFHDIAPAGALGWATCWVDRRRGMGSLGVGLPSDAEPTWTTTDLSGVVDLLARIDPARPRSAADPRVRTTPTPA